MKLSIKQTRCKPFKQAGKIKPLVESWSKNIHYDSKDSKAGTRFQEAGPYKDRLPPQKKSCIKLPPTSPLKAEAQRTVLERQILAGRLNVWGETVL